MWIWEHCVVISTIFYSVKTSYKTNSQNGRCRAKLCGLSDLAFSSYQTNNNWTFQANHWPGYVLNLFRPWKFWSNRRSTMFTLNELNLHLMFLKDRCWFYDVIVVTLFLIFGQKSIIFRCFHAKDVSYLHCTCVFIIRYGTRLAVSQETAPPKCLII